MTSWVMAFRAANPLERLRPEGPCTGGQTRHHREARNGPAMVHDSGSSEGMGCRAKWAWTATVTAIRKKFASLPRDVMVTQLLIAREQRITQRLQPEGLGLVPAMGEAACVTI